MYTFNLVFLVKSDDDDCFKSITGSKLLYVEVYFFFNLTFQNSFFQPKEKLVVDGNFVEITEESF